jgi:putative transposase
MPVFGKTNEPPIFSGRFMARGLYRTKIGILLNADVNGAYNILRKAVPTTAANG